MSAEGRESVWAPGVRALKASWPPMLAIQVLLVAVVVGYFVTDGVGDVLEMVAEVKNRGPILFALVAGFVSGGWLPELGKLVAGRLKGVDKKWLGDTFYTGLVYAWIALSVWTLYVILDGWFGPTESVFILGQKVLFDQLVFSPFYSIPLATHLFGWKDDGFKGRYFRNVFSWTHYKKHVAPKLVMCWAFWGPSVSCIYLLPENLQFVIGSMLQAVWSLLFVFMVSDKIEDAG